MRRDAEDDGEEPEDADEEEHPEAGMVADRVGRRDRARRRSRRSPGRRAAARAPTARRRGCRARRPGAARSRRRGARRRDRARSRRARSSRARCSGSRRRSSPSVAGCGVVFCACRGMKRTRRRGDEEQRQRGAVGELPARRRRGARRRPGRRSSRSASSSEFSAMALRGSPAARGWGRAIAAPGRRRRAPCRRRRGWRKIEPDADALPVSVKSKERERAERFDGRGRPP